MAKTETAPNKESAPKRRQLSGWQAQLVAVLCIVWASFHLVVASGLILVPPAQLRAVHLGAAMVLCFLLVPGRKGASLSSVPVLDWILMAIAAGIMGYMYFRYETLIRMGGRTEPQDIYIGLAGMVILFEAARRTISPGLVALALILVIGGSIIFFHDMGNEAQIVKYQLLPCFLASALHLQKVFLFLI